MLYVFVALCVMYASVSRGDLHGVRSSFLMVDNGWMTLNYLHPNAEKLRMRAAAIANGDTHIDIYSRNAGDNFGSSFKNVSSISPSPDWEAQLDTLNDIGLKPVIWLTPDDSPEITSKPISDQQAHFSEVVRRFDNKVSGYVACLECDEYWSAAKTNALVAHLKSITNKPVGVHLTSGVGGHTGNKEYYTNADYVYLQTGWNKTPAEITAMVKQAIAITGKPVVAAEYAKESRSVAARALGDAACLAGAVGTGNGRSIHLCGQRKVEKKKEWYQEYEKELIVTGIGIATLFAVLNYSKEPKVKLYANDNGYELRLKSDGYSLRYSEDKIMATYRIEF